MVLPQGWIGSSIRAADGSREPVNTAGNHNSSICTAISWTYVLYQAIGLQELFKELALLRWRGLAVYALLQVYR